jgi:nitrate reductase gamma subunit
MGGKAAHGPETEEHLTMSFLNNLLFGYYPYIAGTVFLLGSLVRFDMSQYTWKTNSSQLLDNSFRFQVGSVLFHVGVLFLFLGHLVGLLMPHWLYPYFGLTAESKQIMAMVSGGIAGVIALVGGTILLHRRLYHPRVRAHSTRMDIFILVLLYAQLILGLFTIAISGRHLDGSMMLVLADWAQRIVTFRPGAADYIAGVHWVYKVHLFLGLTIFLVFPFTRLVHIWSIPVGYVARQYQIVRRRAV